MKEPGLDDRHRNKDGTIHKKLGSTLNKNLSEPIPGFSPNAKLKTMRKETGKKSVAAVRKTAKRIRPTK